MNYELNGGRVAISRCHGQGRKCGKFFGGWRVMAGEVEGWRGVGGAYASSRGVGKSKFIWQLKTTSQMDAQTEEGLIFALLAILGKTEILT